MSIVGKLISSGFFGNLLFKGASRIQFRDTGIYIGSSADGKLVISSDGTGADDITIVGSQTVTGDMVVTGDVTLTGDLDITGTLTSSGTYVAVPDGATYTVLAANSGKIHIMPDLTASCTISLPTAAAGLVYEFISKGVAEDAQNWVFDTGSDTNFYLGGLTELDTTGDTVVLEVPDGDSNSKMTIVTPAPGTRILMICDGTNWILSGVVQSDTADAVTWADQ